MTWRPLIEDAARRAQLAGVIREIVDALAGSPPGQHPLGELGDRAIMRAYLAQDGTIEDPDDEVSRSLGEAVTKFAAGGTASPALAEGAAGIGWLVEHLAGGETADQVCASVDAALLRRLDGWVGDYDLISGLVGLGVYALERGEAGKALASRVLDEIERIGRPRSGGTAWHTGPDLLPPWQREVAPEGYWNLGLAHGNPGVVALLARYVRHDIDRVRAGALLDRAMTSMLAEPFRESGRYVSWLPNDRPATRRIAWCYGDLGAALALYAAAVAASRDDWRTEALTLAANCARTQFADAEVVDCGLCHGAAGAAHLFNRMYQATGDALYRDAALRWVDRIFELRRSGESFAGFPAATPTTETKWTPDASLLSGAPGVALALHAVVSEIEPSWDRWLLVDL